MIFIIVQGYVQILLVDIKMIELVIFDLDGTLVNSKEIHFKALNNSIEKFLGKEFKITKFQHLNKFDGLSTLQKLKLLKKEYGFSQEKFSQIAKEKEINTKKMLSLIEVNKSTINVLKYLKRKKIKVALCTNAKRYFLNYFINDLNYKKYFDYCSSNEDVKNKKPNPEQYLLTMAHFGISPLNTFIFEDSNHGVNAAINSCANYYIVKNYTELNLSIIKNKVIKMNKIKPIPKYDDLNILIPMAGAGSRFFQAGYTFPKPLISIKNLTMIEVVLKSLNIDGNFIFIVRKEDIEKYNINYFLKNLKKKCKIVILDKITEGAACSALIAKKYINNKNPLIIANSDQYIEWDPIDFMYKLNNSKDISGGILTFKSNHPKWSYVKVNKNLLITKTVEKKPISDRATVGVYFWSKGSDFVESAEEMIMKNDRTNNEFYICPSFNYLIKKKKKIIEYKIDEMWGLGTPEDLRYFIDNKLEDISEWFD